MKIPQNISYSINASEKLSGIGEKFEDNKSTLDFRPKKNTVVAAAVFNCANVIATGNKIQRIGGDAFVVSESTKIILEDNDISDISKSVVRVEAFEKLNLNDLLEEIRTIVEALQLPPDIKEELLSDVTTTEVQLQSPKPKKNIINASLTSIKSIIEGAAGSEVHGQLHEHIPNIIASITDFLTTSI